MDGVTYAFAIVSGLIELLRESQETGATLTKEQVDEVISERKAAEAENAAGDPDGE